MSEQAQTERRYCEDCRLFETSANKINGRCNAPAAVNNNNARFIAREFDVAPFATVMRIVQCGPDAKWFEPKPAQTVT